ncbi:hypothetical protein GCM10008014_51400 [Paenibacillus silvae]|uniref:HTH cro/C1-type domain-containing protein n=1 Tax=Paenibacillus silvae TaxID=1325358 RepID=A0ABQ1ZJ75_9BACL|nr:hypothetical protein [Paenibacillus silvae]GGH68704.1 hypothetical protein GCM10008014_51400 [Paenibacillus silvae]
MSLPRWIETEELLHFINTNNTPGQREAWIRNEFNAIYPGEYTPPKVADQCKVITAQGLRKLENEEGSRPRHSTLKALSEFYNIPLEVFTEPTPERFYLGKPKSKLKSSDVRGPFYRLNLSATLEKPSGEVETQPLISDLTLRHMDFEQLCDMIKMLESWIKKGLVKQGQLDDAYDKLMRNEEND